MATVQDLVNQALLDLGTIAQGETPNATESGVALNQLNRILSSFSLEGTFVYTHAVGVFALVAGIDAYTMGAGAAWNTGARPVKIKGAKISYQGLERGVVIMPMGEFEQSLKHDDKPVPAIEYLASGQPVSTVLAQWAAAALPLKLGEDSAAPQKNIRVWPVQTVNIAIEVSYWTPLALFVALTDAVAFPVPGYELALINELTAILAPSYGRGADLQTYIGIAQRSKARVQTINAMIELPAPAAAPAQP